MLTKSPARWFPQQVHFSEPSPIFIIKSRCSCESNTCDPGISWSWFECNMPTLLGPLLRKSLSRSILGLLASEICWLTGSYSAHAVTCHGPVRFVRRPRPESVFLKNMWHEIPWHQKKVYSFCMCTEDSGTMYIFKFMLILIFRKHVCCIVSVYIFLFSQVWWWRPPPSESDEA